MSERAKSRCMLLIVAVLTVAAVWLNLRDKATYASMFNQPRLNEIGRASCRERV